MILSYHHIRQNSYWLYRPISMFKKASDKSWWTQKVSVWGSKKLFSYFIHFSLVKQIENFVKKSNKSIQCSPLDSNPREPTKFDLIMRCFNYEFASNIKCNTMGSAGTIITWLLIYVTGSEDTSTLETREANLKDHNLIEF